MDICDSIKEEQVDSVKSRRQSQVQSTSSENTAKQIKCSICFKYRIYNSKIGSYVREKFRISEKEKATRFLEHNLMLKDNVSVQYPHLICDGDVFAADIYCHKLCFCERQYEYERLLKVDTQPTQSKKLTLLKKYVSETLLPELEKGKCFKIYEIADLISNISADEECVIRPNEVQRYLTLYFANDIQVYKNPNVREGNYVFSSKLSDTEVSLRMRQVTLIENAGKALKKAIKSVDFALDDSFCDAHELKSSWEKVSMPEEWLVFYSALHKIPKTELVKPESLPILQVDEKDDNLDDDEDDLLTNNQPNSNLHESRAFCDFQIVFNKINHGNQKVPLCEMLTHSIYHKTRSKRLLTTMNHLGITYSYSEVRRSRALKVQHSVEASRKFGIPFPPHFNKECYTMGALDNEDYSDNSSISGDYFL